MDYPIIHIYKKPADDATRSIELSPYDVIKKCNKMLSSKPQPINLTVNLKEKKESGFIITISSSQEQEVNFTVEVKIQKRGNLAEITLTPNLDCRSFSTPDTQKQVVKLRTLGLEKLSLAICKLVEAQIAFSREASSPQENLNDPEKLLANSKFAIVGETYIANSDLEANNAVAKCIKQNDEGYCLLMRNDEPFSTNYTDGSNNPLNTNYNQEMTKLIQQFSPKNFFTS